MPAMVVFSQSPYRPTLLERLPVRERAPAVEGEDVAGRLEAREGGWETGNEDDVDEEATASASTSVIRGRGSWGRAGKGGVAEDEMPRSTDPPELGGELSGFDAGGDGGGGGKLRSTIDDRLRRAASSVSWKQPARLTSKSSRDGTGAGSVVLRASSPSPARGEWWGKEKP